MAKFICKLKGYNGKFLMKLYDTKCVIVTKDGEKTIFFGDIVGVYFRNRGLGCLKFDTASVKTNDDDIFSAPNTFTYDTGKNGITEELMKAVYNFITDRMEELKYGTTVISEIPDFEAMIECNKNEENKREEERKRAEEKKKKEEEELVTFR